jgi:integrase
MKGCRPLTDNEIKRVAESFDGSFHSRDRAFFILGTRTGFRVSELLSLRVKDVTRGADEVLDQISVARQSMKQKVEGRTVYVHSEAKAALAAWLEEMGQVDGNTFLFLSRKGENNPMSRVHAWRILNRAFEKVDVTGSTGTHSMRKSFAAKAYEVLKGDLVKTAKALGHRNINSTVSYLSFNDADIWEALTAA